MSSPAFAALAVRDYRRYWAGGLLSNVGTAMQGVALDWYVLQLTGSGTAVGWAAGLQFAPVLVFGLWGGVLSDRYDRRRLLLVGQSLYAVQGGVLAIAVGTGHAPLALVYVLCFALGCVFTVENPARLAFVTELVGGSLIANAASLNILSLNAARLVGPAIAGVLIATVGESWVFAINTASFAVVIVALLAIHPMAVERVRTPWAGAGRAGLRYVRSKPRLLAVFTIFGVVATFGVTYPTTMTLFAAREFDVGAAGLGFMSTALAVGTVAGTLAAARRSAPSLRMRGRVMAVYTLISMGGTPIGSPTVGWISQHWGVRWGVGFVAAVSVAAALAVWTWLVRRVPDRDVAPGRETGMPLATLTTEKVLDG